MSDVIREKISILKIGKRCQQFQIGFQIQMTQLILFQGNEQMVSVLCLSGINVHSITTDLAVADGSCISKHSVLSPKVFP